MKWGSARWGYLSCSMIIWCMCFFVQLLEANCLHTVFHHHVRAKLELRDGREPLLELGKLILSFDADPELEVFAGRVRDGSTLVERTFFCQHAEVKDEACLKMLQAALGNQSSLYTFDIAYVRSPMPGIRITFAYDRARVGILYDVFGVGNKKRLIFTFYSKERLRAMSGESAYSMPLDIERNRPGVIIDCGHGGEDPGAMSSSGICEKDVNLSVGLCLAHLLEKRGINVFLTRRHDETLALDARTCLKDENKQAAIFVSIHANAAPNVQAAGIETFYFDGQALGASGQRSRLIGQLMQERSQKSSTLAKCIHESVLEYVRAKYKDTPERRVQHAFLQVLVGAPVPAALVEVGFLTNSLEEVLLRDPAYHMLLAMGMCEGIVRYFERAV